METENGDETRKDGPGGGVGQVGAVSVAVYGIVRRGGERNRGREDYGGGVGAIKKRGREW